MKILIKTMVFGVLISFGMQVNAAKPAARLGDTTSHGGAIAIGSPTVLINGKPAARVTDFATSPLVIPAGFGTIPCVGGPILPPGAVTVLIGSLPAARVGDLGTTACGLPQTIVQGSPNVQIGP